MEKSVGHPIFAEYLDGAPDRIALAIPAQIDLNAGAIETNRKVLRIEAQVGAAGHGASRLDLL